jgi:hypothetical protein
LRTVKPLVQPRWLTSESEPGRKIHKLSIADGSMDEARSSVGGMLMMLLLILGAATMYVCEVII